jgi:hypothetical protein
MQYRVLCTLMQMSGADTGEYIRVMTLNLLVMTWLDTSDHPVHNIISSDPHSMDEEIGEIAFSVLARYVASSPNRNEREQVEKQFIMLPVKMRVANDMKLDIHSAALTGHNVDVAKSHGDELKAITMHLQMMFRQISSNQWRVYDGSPSEWKSQLVAQSKMVMPEVVDRIDEVVTAAKFDTSVRSIKSKVTGFWLTEHTDVWPEADIALPAIDVAGVPDENKSMFERVNMNDTNTDEDDDRHHGSPEHDDSDHPTAPPPAPPVRVRTTNRRRRRRIPINRDRRPTLTRPRNRRRVARPVNNHVEIRQSPVAGRRRPGRAAAPSRGALAELSSSSLNLFSSDAEALVSSSSED